MEKLSEVVLMAAAMVAVIMAWSLIPSAMAEEFGGGSLLLLLTDPSVAGPPAFVSPSSNTGQQDNETCWDEIGRCQKDHVNQSLSNTSDPELNPRSPTFNRTKLFCCNLIQAAAQNDKQCFCAMDDILDQNPSNSSTKAILTILNGCNIADSLASLDSFCSPSGALTSPPAHNLTLAPPPAAKEVGSPPPASNLTPSRAQGKSSKKAVKIVAIAVPSAIFVALNALVIIVLINKKSKEKQRDPPNLQNVSRGNDFLAAESLQYDFETIQAAINNFSDDHKIGEGGFSDVYKGTLPNGQAIAVKRLSKGSNQGDKEFQNEVAVVAKLQHRNLVTLLGFCLTKEEKLLVYEFVPNKSLNYFLFDPTKKGELNWERRYNIIKDIARGMLYLHEDSRLRIIHRDLKAANILLDAGMNPKISDFGIARISNIAQTQENTSRIIGTYGYMAPEYAMHGQYSVKSDVYSFGVLTLEIVSGKKTSEFYQSGRGESLLSWAWKYWSGERPLEVMDSTLMRDSYSKHEVIKCIHVALLCVQDDAWKRPSMATIVHLFNSSDPVPTSIAMPQKPAFLFGRFVDQVTATSSSTSKPWSQNEVSITQPAPR